MTNETELDDDALRKQRDDMLQRALPLVFAGPLLMAESGAAPKPVPFVQLNTTGRPDVADVFRVMNAERGQSHSDRPLNSVFVDGHGYFEFMVAITDPVTCSFSFVLVWPEQREFFDLIAATGGVWVTAQDVEQPLDTGRIVGVRAVDPDMRRLLAAWLALAG